MPKFASFGFEGRRNVDPVDFAMQVANGQFGLHRLTHSWPRGRSKMVNEVSPQGTNQWPSCSPELRLHFASNFGFSSCGSFHQKHLNHPFHPRRSIFGALPELKAELKTLSGQVLAHPLPVARIFSKGENSNLNHLFSLVISTWSELATILNIQLMAQLFCLFHRTNIG